MRKNWIFGAVAVSTLALSACSQSEESTFESTYETADVEVSASAEMDVAEEAGPGTILPDLGEVPINFCLLYTSPSPRDRQKSRMPSSA